MSPPSPSADRVTVDGKFFRLGPAKFHAKGVTYGPFAPDADGVTFASPAQTARDFVLLRELGANVLRTYYAPPRWFLDLAQEHGLKVLVDIPWPKHLCFLDRAESRAEAVRRVTEAVRSGAGHPALFAWSVVNEIPPEIVRWSGARRVERFIDELIAAGRAVDPEALFTFTNFPSTEFLDPRSPDFVCFNVYLHTPAVFDAYLARLQMLADTRPLVLGEFGMDSIREGEAHQAEFLSWQIERAFRGGLAGVVAFSFTDDWHRGGQQIEDWAFGLTTRDRRPKPAYAAVQRQFRVAPRYPLPRTPRVSVVVASYNGGRTLRTCLESLRHLNYPDYEVILVDDGSTDDTPAIAPDFPEVRTIRHENRGLSAARNTGIAAATGEIVAFTDSDCRADEDWLHYLVGDLLRGGFAGIGGHNFLPPEDSLVAAAVMVSPGGPAHVMLDDREAEHIPGCNMAFARAVLEEVGGFDPIFRKAGDDVDLCWRLQQAGHRIGFSSGGFVWHYRRSTVPAYLRQQAGYGEAEALLVRKHPEYFNNLGNGIWRGRIYSASRHGVVLRRSIIYHGVFGSGFFQTLYRPAPSLALMLVTAPEYHALVTLPLVLLAWLFPFLWPLAAASGLLSAGVCVAAAAQAELPPGRRRWWSRPLVAALFFLQPLERGLARRRSLWQRPVAAGPRDGRGAPLAPALAADPELDRLAWWSQDWLDRHQFLGGVLRQLEQQGWAARADSGWTDHDLEVTGDRWTRLLLTTATEQLDRGAMNLRCQLRAAWSGRAWGALASVTAALVLVIGLLAPRHSWVWFLPMLIPFLVVAIEHRQFRCKAALAGQLQAAAEQRGWVLLKS